MKILVTLDAAGQLSVQSEVEPAQTMRVLLAAVAGMVEEKEKPLVDVVPAADASRIIQASR